MFPSSPERFPHHKTPGHKRLGYPPFSVMKQDTCTTRNAERGVRKRANEKGPDLLFAWEHSRASLWLCSWKKHTFQSSPLLHRKQSESREREGPRTLRPFPHLNAQTTGLQQCSGDICTSLSIPNTQWSHFSREGRKCPGILSTLGNGTLTLKKISSITL